MTKTFQRHKIKKLSEIIHLFKDTDKNETDAHKNLVHWARMAPMIEGGIEAPLQFILQVIWNSLIQI